MYVCMYVCVCVRVCVHVCVFHSIPFHPSFSVDQRDHDEPHNGGENRAGRSRSRTQAGRKQDASRTQTKSTLRSSKEKPRKMCVCVCVCARTYARAYTYHLPLRASIEHERGVCGVYIYIYIYIYISHICSHQSHQNLYICLMHSVRKSVQLFVFIRRNSSFSSRCAVCSQVPRRRVIPIINAPGQCLGLSS